MDDVVMGPQRFAVEGKGSLTDMTESQSRHNKGNLGRILPIALLIALMAFKYALVATYPLSSNLGGDEHDYIGKARVLWKTGSFPAIKDVQEDELKYSDFRPPGYSLLIAPLLAFGESGTQIHLTLRILHSALDIVLTFFLFWLACSFSTSLLFRYLSAFILGIQPWTSAFVVSGITETVVTFLTVMGVAALWRFSLAQQLRSRVAWVLAGSISLSLTFTMRPEMIIFVPPVVALAVAAQRKGWRRFFGYGIVASLPFLICVLGLVAHRMHVAGEVRIFGRFRDAAPGLLLWSNTWTSNEIVKSDVVYGTRKGKNTFPLVPAHAFYNNSERKIVRQIINRAHEAGGMTPREDSGFSLLAQQRIQRQPVRRYLWVRSYNCLHLWANLHTSAPLLTWFTSLPRLLSKTAVGAFLAVRLVILGCAIFGTVRLFSPCNSGKTLEAIVFLWLAVFFVTTRTLFFAFYAGAPCQFRYVMPAWPFLIVLSLYGLAALIAASQQQEDDKQQEQTILPRTDYEAASS